MKLKGKKNELASQRNRESGQGKSDCAIYLSRTKMSQAEKTEKKTY